MAINWDKIKANLSGEPGQVQSSKIDWETIRQRLPKQPEQPKPQPVPTPISPIENARNLFAGKGFQAIQKTIEPVKQIQTTQSRRNPFEGLDQPIVDMGVAKTTPMMVGEAEASDPFKAFFGTTRAVLDVAAGGIAAGINELSKDKVSSKELINYSLDLAKKDIATGGAFSGQMIGEKYLKDVSGVKKIEDVTAKDIAVLAGVGLMDLLADPSILIGGKAAQQLKNFLNWKKTGKVTKALEEGAEFVGKKKAMNLQIAEDLKIRAIPKKNEIVIEGYVRRGATPGEVTRSKLAIEGIVDDVAEATGKEITATTKGNNLILSAGETPTTKPVTGKLVFGTKAVETVKPNTFLYAEQPAPTVLARQTNEEITAVNKQKLISGDKEPERLTNNNILQEMKDYGSIPVDATPKSNVTIYRATTDNKINANDLVTTDQALAERYLVNRPGSKIISENIKIADLVKSDGLKSEFYYSPKTTTLADKGGYAEAATKPSQYKAIETPELYRMVKEIDKDLPISVKNYQRFLGVFQHGKMEGEKIGLSRKLFKRGTDETPEAHQQRIAKTFAHEIGHYVDYLPDKVMNRGNLNGRLMVVSDFKKNFVDEVDILKERQKIKREISKITNDQVLLDSQIDKLTEPLKKQLKEIDDKIKFNNPAFKEELVKLSQTWKPWEDGVDSAYDSYRKSAPELYADFVSVLFNNPGLAEETAPKFYREFFNSLDKKPEVQKAFLGIQADLMGDRASLMEKRWNMLKDSGLNAQGKFAAMIAEAQANKKYPWQTNLMRDAWYQHYWAKGISKKTEYAMETYDRGFNNEIFILANKELKPIFEAMQKAGIDSNDLDAVLKLERIASDITRQDVANIKALDQSTAEDVLQELTKIVGEEKAAAMFKAADSLRKVLRDVQAKYPDLWTEETKKLMESNKFYAPFNVLYSESQNIPYYIRQSKGNIDKDFNAVTNSLLRMKAVVNFGEKNLIKKTVIDDMVENGYKDIKVAKKNVIKAENGQMIVNFEKAPKGYELVEIKRNGKTEGYFLPDDIAGSLNQDGIGELPSVLKPFRAMNKPFKKLYTELNPAFQVVNFLFRDWGQANMFFGPEWSRKQIGQKVSTPANIVANNTYRYLLSQFKQGGYYFKALKNLKEKNLFNKYTPIVEEALKNHVIEIDGTGMYKLDPTKFSQTDQKAVEYVLQTMGLTDKIKGWKRVGEVVRGIGQTLEETPKLAAYMYMKDMGLMGGKESEKYKSIIRNYVGSPNFWKRGKNSQEISSILMFYNPIIRGQENLVKKAFVKDAAGAGSRQAFWWRMIRKAFIPALVAVAAEEGFFGDDIKREYNKNPEYLKNNYYTIPLGETKEGKIRSITIPLDEDSRLMHALTRMAAKAALHGGDKSIAKRAIWDILTYTGGQVPSPNPTITIASTWGTALSGGNPYDDFRQQHIFLANEEKLPFSEKAKILTKWTLNQSGQLKLDLRDGVENRTIDEQAIQYTPVVNRFYRITDRGEYEMDQKVAKQVEEQEALKLLEKTKEINSIAEKIGRGEKVDVAAEITQLAKDRLGAEASDVKAYNKEVKLLLNSLQDKYISAFGNVHFRSLSNASNDQKVAVLYDIYNRDTMSNKEYEKMINDALQLKVINAQVAMEVLQMITSKK